MNEPIKIIKIECPVCGPTTGIYEMGIEIKGEPFNSIKFCFTCYRPFLMKHVPQVTVTTMHKTKQQPLHKLKPQPLHKLKPEKNDLTN